MLSSNFPFSILLLLYLKPTSEHPTSIAVARSPARNIQVFNPTTNTLNVRWEAATGPVQQYRVVYAPLTGVRPTQSVSFLPCLRDKKHAIVTTSRFEESIFNLCFLFKENIGGSL